MMIGILGAGSTIAQEFRDFTSDPMIEGHFDDVPRDLDKYLICTGYLAGKCLETISHEEAKKTFFLNFLEPAKFCDEVFAHNPRAKIVLIGSESGFKGSFDMAYAGAKAALHLYVETKRLNHAEQMLVAIAPHVIGDTRMTQRRGDVEALQQRAQCNRLGRWLNAREVAREAYELLYRASTALSGTIIRMRV